MPKVTIGKNIERVTPGEKRAVLFEAAFTQQRRLLKIKNVACVAEMIGVAPASLYGYLRNPEKMQLETMWRIFKVLEFSEEQKSILLK